MHIEFINRQVLFPNLLSNKYPHNSISCVRNLDVNVPLVQMKESCAFSICLAVSFMQQLVCRAIAFESQEFVSNTFPLAD